MNFKRLVCATTALAGGLLLATQASAQSTGTQTQESTEVDAVVITASRGLPTIDGAIAAEQAPKSRSTITQEYISTQSPGQTVIESLNLVPGVSFTQSDAFGSSGGNLRLRSFDGNRVSLTFDGIPLNDTGNYAIYTNQQMDPEVIERATVNLGTTDVDSPTASATGGTVNYLTRVPDDEMGVMLQGSVGSEEYMRLFGLVDSGEFGDSGVSGWLSGSYQSYDKFKGPGDLTKWQTNARLYWDRGEGNFISLAGHYNENRNDFYRNLSLSQIAFYGTDYDNLDVCTRDAPTTGVADNDGSSPAGAGAFQSANDNPANPASCTNFYGLRINPSDTGNVRMQFRQSLNDNLIATFDPYYQYVLANGGGTTVVAENDRRLRGTNGVAAGVDLNFDGDVLDQVRLYTPNTTNTNRVGFTTSLIWDINENHRFRFAYTYDYGRHRQTGEFGFLRASGHPQDVFGGREATPVLGVDGLVMQGRDRFSIAELNQFALEYRGLFMEDRLTVAIGLRAPKFKRELNQNCYTQAGSSNVLCTNEAELAQPSGYVRFNGRGTTDYIRPYERDVSYNDLLPNFGASFRLTDNHVVYVSYAEGLSAPRTDSLYTGPRIIAGRLELTSAKPEKTESWDLGYRYQGDNFIANAALWMSNYDNRIVSAFDDDLNSFVDRNIGSVELWGFDAQAGFEVTENFSIYASAAYIQTELQDDIPVGNCDPDGAGPLPTLSCFIPTSGKELVETPEWTFALRAYYDTEWFSIGAQAKHVGERWSTDMNDELTEDYITVDLDARLKLDNMGFEGTFVQLNVRNLFDEDYLGNISSRENAQAVDIYPGAGTVIRNGSAPNYSISAPRTVMLTLRTRF